MSTTLAELSRRTGFSTATISRALNNSNSVSSDKREVILRAARETDYLGKKARRGSVAHAAKGIAIQSIEIIQHRHSPVERARLVEGRLEVGPLGEDRAEAVFQSSPLTNSFHRQIVDGAVVELEHWGYRGHLAFNHDLSDEGFLSEVNRSDRTGVLVLGEPSEQLGEFVRRCVHPIVLLDMPQVGVPDVVTTDNLAGVSSAFSHLYGLGHRRIGFAGRMDSNFAFAERFVAFQCRMAEAGLAIRADWVWEGPTHVEHAATGIQAMLNGADRPTALVCVNDIVALGAVRAAAALGLAIPDQLSIVGFDDIEAASVVTPALTTVRVPLHEIGSRGVKQLMIQIQSRADLSKRGCCVRLMPELVVRNSTGRAM